MLLKFLRYATALFYMIGGPLIHIYLVTQHREIYGAVDDQAIAFYQYLWNQFVLPNLLLCVALLIAFEIGVGVLIFSGDTKWSTLGHLIGMLFNLLLVPFAFFFAVPNLVLVAWHAWLLLWEEHKVHGGWRFTHFSSYNRGT